jgi:hypothetical protein
LKRVLFRNLNIDIKSTTGIHRTLYCCNPAGIQALQQKLKNLIRTMFHTLTKLDVLASILE